jgi:DNA topoisomerase-2
LTPQKASLIQMEPFFQIKNHMWIFVNALIENPSFDSQTKETLTLQSKSFGSKCDLSEKFIAQTMKCGIVETILAWVRFKQSEVMDKKCSGKKTSKIRDMPKLEDANDAGTKNSAACTLILTEGDSAKSLAVSGLGVIGRDKYGVFPLRGKMLNVREASHKQVSLCEMYRVSHNLVAPSSGSCEQTKTAIFFVRKKVKIWTSG